MTLAHIGTYSPTLSVEPQARARPRIAVVIPCYRVEAQIADVVRSIPAVCALVICVDDASPGALRATLAAIDDPRVVYVRHETNRGVGGAVKTGWREALSRGAEFVVKLDGDGQMNAADIETLMEPLLDGRADFAKGNRFVDHAALRAMPRARLFGNAALSLGVKAVSGYWNVLDPTNGFVAISARLLRRLDLEQLDDRYFFETSVLVELNIHRARVADVALPAHYGAERSSLRVTHSLATFPARLCLSFARRFYWRYLIQDFGIVSLATLLGVPSIIFGATFGGVRWMRSIESGVPATAGTVFVAALPIILGVQLLLVALVLDVLASPTVKLDRQLDVPPRD